MLHFEVDAAGWRFGPTHRPSRADEERHRGEASDMHLTNLCKEIALAFSQSDERVLKADLVTEVMAGNEYDSN